jgi:hypothetical protein
VVISNVCGSEVGKTEDGGQFGGVGNRVAGGASICQISVQLSDTQSCQYASNGSWQKDG